MDIILYALEPANLLLLNLLAACIGLAWMVIDRDMKAAVTIESLEDEIAGLKVLLAQACYQLDKAKTHGTQSQVIDANCADLLEDIEEFLGEQQ